MLVPLGRHVSLHSCDCSGHGMQGVPALLVAKQNRYASHCLLQYEVVVVGTLPDGSKSLESNTLIFTTPIPG